MQNIKLITFDVFGTVLNWKEQVESHFPGRYREFIERSDAMQRHENPTLPYAKLLSDVHAAMSGGPGTGRSLRFGHDFGKTPPFSDAAALKELQKICNLGCISNCDIRHQFDAQRTLGLQWDLCIVSEDTATYKPSMEAWRKAEAKVTASGIKRDEWLHVTAYTDYDLIPAKELGIQTCFIPRPGGSPATDAEVLKPTLMVSDLFQLHEGFVQSHGHPVRYRVTATAPHAKIARHFIKWMRDEHGADLMKVPGCREFRVYRLDDCNVACEYLFNSQDDLNHYFSTYAEEMRAKGRQAFPEELLSFKRDESPLVVLG